MTDFMFGPSPAAIGNDILDIGSRKARRQRSSDLLPSSRQLLGKPGQFDIPAVHDVSGGNKRSDFSVLFEFIVSHNTSLASLH